MRGGALNVIVNKVDSLNSPSSAVNIELNMD